MARVVEAAEPFFTGEPIFGRTIDGDFRDLVGLPLEVVDAFLAAGFFTTGFVATIFFAAGILTALAASFLATFVTAFLAATAFLAFFSTTFRLD